MRSRHHVALRRLDRRARTVHHHAGALFGAAALVFVVRHRCAGLLASSVRRRGCDSGAERGERRHRGDGGGGAH
jgi:hypothetical protein